MGGLGFFGKDCSSVQQAISKAVPMWVKAQAEAVWCPSPHLGPLPADLRLHHGPCFPWLQAACAGAPGAAVSGWLWVLATPCSALEFQQGREILQGGHPWPSSGAWVGCLSVQLPAYVGSSAPGGDFF